MWKIVHIYEADYGCEERQPGEELRCLLELENKDGDTRNIEVPDKWVSDNGLSEGSEIDISNIS